MINEFSFGGVHSSKFKITCDRETHFILPTMRTYTDEVVGYDGVVDYGIGGYDYRTISLDIYFEGAMSELRSMKNDIIGWLMSDSGEYKKLELDDEPNCYYMAKIAQATDFAVSPTTNRIGTLMFMCNPPWQYKNDILQTPDMLAWDNADSVQVNQYMKTFTANGTFKFTNDSKRPIKPIIYIFGSTKTQTDSQRLTLSANGKRIKISKQIDNDCIIIDCENETVTLRSTGESIIGSTTFDGFFEFAVGKCSMNISSSALGAFPNSVDIIIQFSPTA